MNVVNFRSIQPKKPASEPALCRAIWIGVLCRERAKAIVQSFFQSRRPVSVMQPFRRCFIDRGYRLSVCTLSGLNILFFNGLEEPFDRRSQGRPLAHIAGASSGILSRSFSCLWRVCQFISRLILEVINYRSERNTCNYRAQRVKPNTSAQISDARISSILSRKSSI